MRALHLFGIPLVPTYFIVETGDSAMQALMAGARHSDCVAGHGGPRRRGLRGALPVLMRFLVLTAQSFGIIS